MVFFAVVAGAVLALVLLSRWVSLTNRIDALERELEDVKEAATADTPAKHQLQTLAQRIERLEAAMRTATAPVGVASTELERPVGPPPAPAAVPAAPHAAPAPPPVARPVSPPTPPPAPPVARPVVRPVASHAAIAAQDQQAHPQEPSLAVRVLIGAAGQDREHPTTSRERETAPQGPSLIERQAQRLRDQLRREEWEAVIGGNWLNKLGVLVLIIGISLFLGYSLTQLGPAGRVGVGLAVSVSLLAAGVGFERKPRYVMFGRGLIGGGWAGVYFTTYAAHGLDAARVIANPVVAAAALMLVAAGMILHSLRYRSQVVTGLAYFVGFATLAIAPPPTFSLAATIPLAASLLWVAERFSWTPMAVVGLVTTYGTYVVTTAPRPAVSMQQFAREQVVVVLYWLLFEAFDLFCQKKARTSETGRLLFPLNACGFIGVSLLRWSSFTPATLSLFFGISTAAYVTSTIARAVLLGRTSGTTAGGSPVAAGASYRASVTLAVALIVPGILLRFTGLQINIAFLLVGEFLFLSGLQFGDSYLRWLAAILLAMPVIKSVALDPQVTMPALAIMSWTFLRWTPVAVLAAAVLYINRALLSKRTLIEPEGTYRVAASALVAFSIGFETPQKYLGAAWVVFGLTLFEIGVRPRLEEFRRHSYAIGALGLLTMAGLNLNELAKHAWSILALDAALAYSWMARLELLKRGTAWDSEQKAWWHVCSWSGALLAAALVWTLTPTAYLAPVWLLLALAFFEAGLTGRWVEFVAFRHQAYIIATLAVAYAVTLDVLVPHGQHWRLLAVTTLLIELGGARQYFRRVERVGEGERELVKVGSSLLGTALLTALAWHMVPRAWIGVAWLLLAVMLLEVALWLARAEWKSEAYVVGTLATITLFHDAFPPTVVPSQLLAVLGSATALYWYAFARIFRLRADRLPQQDQAAIRDASAACGTALVGILFWQLLPVPVVAIAWGVLGLLLLDLGSTLRVTSLRLYGHAAMASMAGRLLLANLTGTGMTFGISHRVLTMVPAVGALYFVSTWLKRVEDAGDAKAWERGLSRTYSYAATLAAVLLVRFELGRTVAIAGWATMVLVLVVLGFRSNDRDLRRQSYVIAILTFVRSWTSSFYIPENLAGSWGRFTIAGIVIGTFYVVQLLVPRSPLDAAQASEGRVGALLESIERHARAMFSLMATLLLATLLFNEMSAGFLTVAWGVQGAVLLATGFLIRDQILRRSGLLLLAVCTTKAFAYDFRQLEPLFRILSFIVLGVLMLVTSWTYARYRERLHRIF